MRITPYVRCFVFALLAMLILAIPAPSSAQVAVGITVGFAPPDLPVYEQPICPGDDYIWAPGYWAWDADYDDYYWVPGTWVLAPEPGFLWTPAYWGWGGNGFVFYEGYWAYQVVGFYGGINYGFGYFGHGYDGGRWQDGHFYYNRSVTNVNVTVIHNVYNTTVVNERSSTRVSYNGGNGGINARPTSQEEAAAHARHLPPPSAQQQHMQQARSNPELRASQNHGKPAIAATARPAAFSGGGVVRASEAGTVHGGPNHAPRENNNPGRANAVHARDLPPLERPTPANPGNPKQDRKYQQQQQKLYAQQQKERQKLEQQQEKEDQRIARQKTDENRRQQTEQRHQQQTQQMEQRHTEQRQQLEQRTSTPPPREKH